MKRWHPRHLRKSRRASARVMPGPKADPRRNRISSAVGLGRLGSWIGKPHSRKKESSRGYPIVKIICSPLSIERGVLTIRKSWADKRSGLIRKCKPSVGFRNWAGGGQSEPQYTLKADVLPCGKLILGSSCTRSYSLNSRLVLEHPLAREGTYPRDRRAPLDGVTALASLPVLRRGWTRHRNLCRHRQAFETNPRAG